MIHVSKIIEMVYQNGVFKPLKLEEIKKESKKVRKAYRVLEEVRDARY